MRFDEHPGKARFKRFFPLSAAKRWVSPSKGLLAGAGSSVLQVVTDFLVEEKCVVCREAFPVDHGGARSSPGSPPVASFGHVSVTVGIFKIKNRTLCRHCLRKFDRARKPGFLAPFIHTRSVGAPGDEGSCDHGGIDSKDPLTCAPPPGISEKPLMVIAPWMTNDAVLSIVHLIKYRSFTSLVDLVVDSIFDAYTRFEQSLPRGDVLIPVPAHPDDLLKRGFNQAGLIAEGLSGRVGIPVRAGVLRKIRRTRRQSQTPPAERVDNVRMAFAARSLRGEEVFLVDDLLTTGATAASCACALLAAGAGGVSVLCFGRAL